MKTTTLGLFFLFLANLGAMAQTEKEQQTTERLAEAFGVYIVSLATS